MPRLAQSMPAEVCLCGAGLRRLKPRQGCAARSGAAELEPYLLGGVVASSTSLGACLVM